MRHSERIGASFAGFRPIRGPNGNPTRFGAPHSPRATISTMSTTCFEVQGTT
jgi:hypothetical protein